MATTPDSFRGTTVAIIMDGNGRWASEHGVSVTEGHRAGGRALRRTVEAALDLGLAQLTVYAFSTENWQRDPGEVAGIMQLFDELLVSEVPELRDQGVRMCFPGRDDIVPDALNDRMQWARNETAECSTMQLAICFNYGGRTEIVDAVNRVLQSGATEVTERDISDALYEPHMADPDLIIRTAGEQRISNFLTWQSIYSELVFSDTLWPDFGEADLTAAMNTFAGRDRRYGGRADDGATEKAGV